VGSETEYECLAVGLGGLGLMVPGLDRAIGRCGPGVDGRTASSLGLGVGGHNGLRWSKIGLEISRLSTEGVREERDERDEGPLLLVCYDILRWLPEVNAAHSGQGRVR
jgi:hypothetical protein